MHADLFKAGAARTARVGSGVLVPLGLRKVDRGLNMDPRETSDRGMHVSGESELAAARERVRAALEAKIAGEDAEEDLADAAMALLAATDTYIGECQQAAPPGKLFYAMDIKDGLVVRCTHDPYHQAKP